MATLEENTEQTPTPFPPLQPSFPNSNQNPENPVGLNPEFLQKIKELSEKGNGPQLKNWVKKHRKDKNGFIKELSIGLKCAQDPYKLVLDGLENGNIKGETNGMLLEGLMKVEGVELSEEVRERGKNLALSWKERVFHKRFKFPLMGVALLRLLGCFGLVEEFTQKDVLEFVFSVAASNYPKTGEICRGLGLEAIVPDLVQKLISNGKQHLAIKFVYEFKLEDKFPPAEVLKSYLNRATKTQNLNKNGSNPSRSWSQANEQELTVLRTVLNCNGAYELGSQYPPELIEKRVKILEELKERGKSMGDMQQSNLRMSKQKARKQRWEARRNNPAAGAHANSNLAAGFSSSMSVDSLPPSQHCLQPPKSHPYASGSQLPSYNYNLGTRDNHLAAYANPNLAAGFTSNMSLTGLPAGSQLPSYSYNSGTRDNHVAAHANPNLAAGFTSNKSLTGLPAGSQFPSYSYNSGTRFNHLAAHANPQLAAGFTSNMSLTGLPPSQQHYLQPPMSHLHASGSQFPSNNYNLPNPYIAYGFPPPHHPPYYP